MTVVSDRFAALREVCEAAVATDVIPGAVVLVVSGGVERFHQAFGVRARLPTALPATVETVYDVASVTKAAITSLLAMQALEKGTIALDAPVARFVSDFRGDDKRAVTIRHLLCHASGLPAHRPFYEAFLDDRSNTPAARDIATRRAAIVAAAATEPLEGPPGQRAVYSDLGFILLGDVLERCGGARLDELARRGIISPLGLEATTFVAVDGRGDRTPDLGDVVAATERCARRGRLLRGEVHDLNAFAMGGIAGHAGLFSTARDLGRLAGALVAAWHGDGGATLVSTELLREFWRPAGVVPGSTWRLGWDGPATRGSQAGDRLSRQAVGHLGFTGCSLWIDPVRRLWIVLLTNRVHPSVRDDPRFRAFRPAVHDAAMAALADG